MIIKHGLLLKTAKQIVEQTVFRKKVKALEEFYKLKYCSTVVYMVPRA